MSDVFYPIRGFDSPTRNDSRRVVAPGVDGLVSKVPGGNSSDQTVIFYRYDSYPNGRRRWSCSATIQDRRRHPGRPTPFPTTQLASCRRVVVSDARPDGRSGESR